MYSSKCLLRLSAQNLGGKSIGHLKTSVRCKIYNHDHLIVYITGVTVAAIAWIVHLMFSIDQKLDRKGGNSPRPHQCHPMPQGHCTFHAQSNAHRPPEVHQKPTNNPTKNTQLSLHQNALSAFAKVPPHPPTWWLPAWVEQYHLFTKFNFNLHPSHHSQLGGHTIKLVYSNSQVSPLTSWHAHKSAWARVKVIRDRGYAHLPSRSVHTPHGWTQSSNATPNQKKKMQ